MTGIDKEKRAIVLEFLQGLLSETDIVQFVNQCEL